MLKDSLTVLTWADVKAQVSAVNPEFAKNVETIPGVDRFTVVRARYPFGAPLVDAGQFYLYINGQSVPYESPLVPKKLREHFDYFWKSFPFGIITQGGFENYLCESGYVMPARQLKQGYTFNKIIVFDEDFSTSHFINGLNNIVAGSRALCALPTLSDPQGNHELAEKYNFNRSLYPQNLDEQWALLSKIIQVTKSQSTSYCEVLYFSKAFLEDKKGTLEFRYSQLRETWIMTGFLRSESMYNLVFDLFSKQFPALLKQNHHIMLTAWHIIKSTSMSIAYATHLTPVIDNLIIPIDCLDQSLLNVYGLRQLPIYMATTIYDGQSPVYYSLQRPIFMYPLSGQTDKNTIATLKAIKSIIAQFREFCYRHNDSRDILHGTPLYERFKTVEFDFFHPKGGVGIRDDIQAIFDEDSRFTDRFKGKPEYDGLALPLDSEFFKGCIRMRPVRVSEQKQTITVKTNDGGSVELTLREYQCFELAAQRKTSKEIGAILGNISPRTVETHLNKLHQKLGCQFKSQLEALWALQKK